VDSDLKKNLDLLIQGQGKKALGSKNKNRKEKRMSSILIPLENKN
jgi:hypothetical protein